MEKRFEFGLEVSKARIDEEGRMIVTGYASDTIKDKQRDKFDTHAMRQMLGLVREGVPLMTSHKDSFGFGESLDGKLIPVEGGGFGLEVDFYLKPQYPQSQELFNEVRSGECSKQLSVGGNLNKDNPHSAYMLNDGTRVLHDFSLDHFCTTRPNKAANPRTHFKEAVFKSLEENGMTEEVWKSLVVDDDTAKALSDEGGDIEKFFFMMPGTGSNQMDGSRDEDDELSGENRTIKDLPSFKAMSDHGYNAYVAPLFWEGDPIVSALKGARRKNRNILEKIDTYPVDEVAEYMKKVGIKNPQSVAEKGKVGLYAAMLGAENLDDRNVGLDPTMTKPVRYVRVFSSQINNEDESVLDDKGLLKGGGFLFTKEGRKVPGEEGYSQFWRVPTVMEAKVLIPDAVDKLDEIITEKGDDFGVEKTGIDLEEIQVMPFGVRKFKLRTLSTEDHSHELRLHVDPDGDIMDGYTFQGASDFAHGHRTYREDHVHNIIDQGGVKVLSVAQDHIHDFVFPEVGRGVVMEKKVNQRSVKEGGYFTVGPKGGGAEVFEETPKSSDFSQIGNPSYALLIDRGDDQAIRQLGKVSRTEANKAGLGATKEGVNKVTVGRSIGKTGKRLIYRMLTEFSPETKEKEKVVTFRAYPMATTRRWSFTGREGDAILDQFGGEDSQRAWQAYANAHGWYDSAVDTGNDPPRVKGAYSLPHHKLENGELRTYPGGVIAATAAINGARGGVTRIPEGDRRAVYNHLARHYGQMDMTPPPYRGGKEGNKELDEGYIKEFIEFHKDENDLDVSWILDYFQEESTKEINEEVSKMGGEEKKTKDAGVDPATTEEVKDAPASEETVVEEPTKEAPKEDVSYDREAEGLGRKLLTALGLRKGASPKVERANALLESAKDALDSVEIEDSDAVPLISSVVGVLTGLKAKIEDGKIDLENLPEKEAKIIRAFLGDDLSKVAPKEETVEAPETSDAEDKNDLSNMTIDDVATKVGETLLPQIKELLNAPKEDDTGDAPQDEGDAPKEGDEDASDQPPDGDAQKDEKEPESKDTEETEKSDDSEVEKSDDKLSQILDLMNGLHSRVEKIETVSGVSKSLDGQEVPTAKKGTFTGALFNPHARKKMGN